MVTKRLQKIFLLTLIPIYFHGIEEIITDFPRLDSFMNIGGNYLNISPEQFYWIFHIIWWAALPTLYFLFHKKRAGLWLFSLFGIFFVVELHHIYKALEWWSYYPGLITAFIYPIIGFFYWKELINNWRKDYGRY